MQIGPVLCPGLFCALKLHSIFARKALQSSAIFFHLDRLPSVVEQDDRLNLARMAVKARCALRP